MEPLNGRPNLLKRANLSLIRRAIRDRGTATRAEIAEETRISSTTVRSLLAELLENGEIEGIGYDESSGGRKAERYALCPERYHSAAFCITGSRMDALIVNVCGEIVETARMDVGGGEYEAAIDAYLAGAAAAREIRSIGVGVPGIVEGGGFRRKNERGELCEISLGKALAERYGVPVVLENDLNATAIGFGRRYGRERPEGDSGCGDMAYLHFERDCVSAGFLAGGRILRGSGNFAGELGLLPLGDGRLLDEHIAAAADDAAYVRLVALTVRWVCGVLNPRLVVLGGPDFRADCAEAIRGEVLARLPERMRAEILYSPEVWDDYHAGMAQLTAAKMFDEVQLLKE